MTFVFIQDQIDQLRAARQTAQDILASNPAAIGAYASAYQVLFSMITEQDSEGQDMPKAGVDHAAERNAA